MPPLPEAGNPICCPGDGDAPTFWRVFLKTHARGVRFTVPSKGKCASCSLRRRRGGPAITEPLTRDLSSGERTMASRFFLLVVRTWLVSYPSARSPRRPSSVTLPPPSHHLLVVALPPALILRLDVLVLALELGDVSARQNLFDDRPLLLLAC